MSRLLINKLRACRFGKGISQWKLAKISGVLQSRISLFENILIQLRADEKEKIAKALGVEKGELFDDRNKKLKRKEKS